MKINLITVQHGGTHFMWELLNALGVEYEHWHADAKSIIEVTKVFDQSRYRPTVFALRNPFDVAETMYRRTLDGGRGDSPYLARQLVSDWFHNLAYLELEVCQTPGGSHQFRVDPDPSDRLTEYVNLLHCLNAEPTPEANQFVMVWNKVSSTADIDGHRLLSRIPAPPLDTVASYFGY